MNMMQDKSFFTTVGCIEGQCQEAVISFGKKKFGAHYPDTITEYGAVKKFSKDVVDPVLKEKIRFKIVQVSIKKHHSAGVIVYGHEQCNGNHISDDEQKDEIRRSAEYISNVIENVIPVIGVWVKKEDDTWIAEEVPMTAFA